MREYDKSKYVNPFNPTTELKDYRDFKNMIDTAVYEKALEIAKNLNLKEENSSVDFIVKVTGLSREEIEKL